MSKDPNRNSKGQLKGGGPSLNPGGRPAGIRKKVKDLCKKYNYDPIVALIEIAIDEKTANKDKIVCAREILDRGYGKAQQYIETSEKIVEITVKRKEEDEDQD